MCEQTETTNHICTDKGKNIIALSHSAVGNQKRVPNSELVANTCCEQSFNPAVIDSRAFILIESWKQYAYFYEADVIISLGESMFCIFISAAINIS